MPDKKQRYFTVSDPIDVKQEEKEVTQEPRPNDLFVCSDDELEIIEQNEPVTTSGEDLNTDTTYDEFKTTLVAVVGDVEDSMVEKLFKMYSNSSNILNEALDFYFNHQEERSTTRDGLKRQKLENQSQRSDNKVFEEKLSEVKEVVKSERNDYWSKYIGSMELQAWATRPTVKGLNYMDELEVKFIKSNTHKSKGDAVRLFTVSKIPGTKGREIGRVPEDWTRIFMPLLDFGLAEFKSFVIIPTQRRLSIGDSFYIQIQCYLKQQAFLESSENLDHFELAGSDKAVEHMAKKDGLGSNVEKKFKLRQYAISRLFDKLNIIPISPRKPEVQPSQVNVVDSEDEEIQELSTKDIDNLSIEDLQGFYDQTVNNDLFENLPDDISPPAENFSLSLREYQAKGLAWMLTRENEYDRLESLLSTKGEYTSSQFKSKVKGEENNALHPLWREYEWPQKIKTSSSDATTEYFYANMYSGELSLVKPVVSSFSRGGILADEMGLGKTISMLSLINSVPYDTNFNTTDTKGLYYAYQSTLLIVPMSLLSQWKNEFERSNSNPNHKCIIYYGDSAESDLEYTLSIRDKDIPVVVLTTYGTVVNKYMKMKRQERQNMGKRSKNGIFSIRFFRIVLDEAHNIRNTATKTSKAICELSSSRKWVLTGTPIINKLDDLYSLLKFLRIEPWSNVAYWKTFVTLPFEQREISRTLDVVRSILDPVFLRRTKSMKNKEGSMLITLPEKEVIIEEVEFSKREEAIYTWFKTEAAHSLRECIKTGQMLKKYSQILTHILRLRQLCCHINLVGDLGEWDEVHEDEVDNVVLQEDTLKVPANDDSEKFSSENAMDEVKEDLLRKVDFQNCECSICMQQPIKLNDLIVAPCSHTFCFTCIVEYVNYNQKLDKKSSCPVCRSDMSLYKLFTIKSSTSEIRAQLGDKRAIDHSKPYLQPYDPTQYSAKIHALIKHLKILKEKCPGEQLIVFSQFASYLDIIEDVLKSRYDQEFIIYKFNGRISLAERQNILEKFSDKKLGRNTITILLITLKTGGVGLNLTSCSTAVIMDPWWSPNIEDQAIDRIHRIGQNKNVKVIRFIIKNSIEQKILRIQDRKKQLGEAVGIEEEERRKQRIQEIQSLFEE